MLTREQQAFFPQIVFSSLDNTSADELSENVQTELLLIIEWPEDTVLIELVKRISPYYVFISKDLVTNTSGQLEFVKRMLPSVFDPKDMLGTVEIINSVSFEKQSGSKLQVKDIVVAPNISSYSNAGNDKLSLTLNSPTNFQPILSWKHNFILERDKPLEIWPEFELEEGIELKYRILRMKDGNSDSIVSSKTYSLAELRQPIIIKETGSREFISVSLLGKGVGTVEIGPVHWRFSRLSFGQMILGGNRFSDAKRQEFFYYFNPVDLKPPLNVYFSGYRPAEGFEGFHMMKELGTPFLLIADPRLEGGSFYLGSEEYEQGIKDVINQYLNYLGFDQQQLILSGLSMGTFGALYYGAMLKPNAIIIGKPLVNLGQVAANIRTVRPNEFGTASDLVLTMTKGTTQNHVAELNNRFWDVFKQSDFIATKLYVSYMQHDDYDATAFDDIIKNNLDSGLQVVSKGFEGRHNDNSIGVIRWFIYRFREHLSQEFKRDFYGME